MSGSPVAPSIHFDPGDREFQADPHAFYRELRERASLARVANRQQWVVCGYDLIRSLLRDPRVDAEIPPAAADQPDGQHPFLGAREEARTLFASMLHHQGPADHKRLRRLVLPAFSPKRVAARRARIQELTDASLDAALARGRMDVVDDLARPVAVTIAGEVLGIPEASRSGLGDLSCELIHQLDTPTSPVRRERGILAMLALAPALRELIADWRTCPPTDGNLLWALEQARESGSMTEDEVLGHGALLLFAGQLTSRHLIGAGLLALMRHPDQWDLLRAQPELIETAVEELLRYENPAPALARTAREEFEFAGEVISPGDSVLLLTGAANRDPAVFADPERLDITRRPNPHLAFGHDAHYCVGAALARLEAEVAIGTFVRRVPRPRLETETVEWEETFVLRGPTSLPVVLESA